MKIYKWFFVLFTLAQLVFTVMWLLIRKHLDRVVLLSSTIYAGGMIIGYISYEVGKYQQRKKELLDNLP
ncbi:MAG TPA: hypothetical protein VI385_00730 [Flavisolibacter sp.]